MAEQHIHLDPEFETFTYGDPTTPKRSLHKLERGDYLIFYCGLQEWDEETGWQTNTPPALYLAGYFVVEHAGMASEFSKSALKREFGKNFHVRYPSVFEKQPALHTNRRTRPTTLTGPRRVSDHGRGRG